MKRRARYVKHMVNKILIQSSEHPVMGKMIKKSTECAVAHTVMLGVYMLLSIWIPDHHSDNIATDS